MPNMHAHPDCVYLHSCANVINITAHLSIKQIMQIIINLLFN